MPDPSSLTTAERATLDALRKYIDEKGFPPTIRELTAALGLTAFAAVHERLGNLVEGGFVHKEDRGHRCYIPTEFAQKYELSFDLHEKVKAYAKAYSIKPATIINEAVARYVEGL